MDIDGDDDPAVSEVNSQPVLPRSRSSARQKSRQPGPASIVADRRTSTPADVVPLTHLPGLDKAELLKRAKYIINWDEHNKYLNTKEKGKTHLARLQLDERSPMFKPAMITPRMREMREGQ